MSKKTLFFVDKHSESIQQIVAVSITSERTSDTKLIIQQLKEAITLWVETTDTGRDVFAYAGEDINIGDLNGYEKSKSFIDCMSKCGLDFEIEFSGESDDIIPFHLPLV